MKKVILALALFSSFNGVYSQEDIDCSLNPDHPACQTQDASTAPSIDMSTLDDSTTDGATAIPSDSADIPADTSSDSDDDLDSDSSF